MDISANAVIEMAQKYIGYKEKATNRDLYSFDGNAGSGNYTMFQAELDKAGFWNGAKQGYEWCTTFVAWTFWRLYGEAEAKRALCLTGAYGAGCVHWARYYKEQGRLHGTPEVGDQYFKKGSDGLPCHTGIVTKVNGRQFETIEGNCNNAVRRQLHSLDSGSVYGFGRPHYTIKEDGEMVRYKTLSDIPEGYRAEALELLDLGFKGYGDERGLDVTEDMLRCMIVNLRMCKALIAAMPGENADELLEEFCRRVKLTMDKEEQK